MTDDQEQHAALFWRMGYDTLFIAAKIGVTEAQVYNRLGFIKKLAREQKLKVVLQ